VQQENFNNANLPTILTTGFAVALTATLSSVGRLNLRTAHWRADLGLVWILLLMDIHADSREHENQRRGGAIAGSASIVRRKRRDFSKAVRAHSNR
jgi:hypothetical protein